MEGSKRGNAQLSIFLSARMWILFRIPGDSNFVYS
jgi:hypothetical protein